MNSARASNWKRAQTALQAGADINAPEIRPRSESSSQLPLAPLGVVALATAIQATGERELTDDDLQIVRVLLDAGVPVNHKQFPVQDSYPLHSAVNSGHEPLIRLLLERGATFWLTGNEGGALIKWAARQGLAWFVAEFLQRLGAMPQQVKHPKTSRFLRLLLPPSKLDDPVAQGLQTGLFYAARWGHGEVIKLLLDFGVPVDAPAGADTALMIAAAWGHAEVVELLRSRGADVRARGDRGNNLLLAAAQGGMTDLALEMLEIHGPDSANLHGKTVLHNAAAYCDERLTRALVERGAKLRAHDNGGSSVLHSAAWGGNLWLMNECLRAGESVDVTNRWGYTPLMKAASNGQIEAMQLLVARGANLNHVARYQSETALHYAISGGQLEATRWLISRGANLESEMELMALGTVVTPLMNAAWSAQTAIVELLIQSGARVNAVESDGGHSALHFAAEAESLLVVELLLDAGAEVNLCSAEARETPLMRAATHNRPAIVERLLQAGADLETRDYINETALHKAALADNAELIETLLSAGANAFALNGVNKTPLDLAIENDCEVAINALRDA